MFWMVTEEGRTLWSKVHLPLGTVSFQGPQGDAAHLEVCLLDVSWGSELGRELIFLLSPEEVLCPPG